MVSHGWCNGLVQVCQSYIICLKTGAELFSLKTTRYIPLLLMDKMKQVLSHMEGLGEISRVEDLTEWCTGIMVVPKKTVSREKYILPSFEDTGKAGSCILSWTPIWGSWKNSIDCAYYVYSPPLTAITLNIYADFIANNLRTCELLLGEVERAVEKGQCECKSDTTSWERLASTQQ